MGLIAKLESTPRQVYTGCIGHFGPGQRAQFNVAIRTVLVDRAAGTAEFGVGGGIVWDSETEAEYDECLDKARVLTAPAMAFELLEALRWQPGEADDGFYLLDHHWRRLAGSAEYFGFRFDRAQAAAQLAAAATAWPAQAHKVRLSLDRTGRLTIDAQPMPWPPAEVIRARLAAGPVDPDDRLLYHKTTQREVYARALAACPGCDDVLLWNKQGEVTETCNGNVVARVGGRLITPPIASGLLNGVMRAWLLEQGEVSEQTLRVDELAGCEALWRVNSVRGWQRLALER